MSDDLASAPELVWEYEGGRLRRARPDGQVKTTPIPGSQRRTCNNSPEYGSAASTTTAQPRTAPGCWSTASGRAA